MKFKFNLEKVLNLKKIREDQARKDFYEIQKIYDEQEAYLTNLKNDLENTYQNKYKIQTMGGEITSYLSYFHDFFMAQQKLVENQIKILNGLKKILEEKRGLLIATSKEHKTFLKLKEKRKSEFLKEQKKKDQKMTDEQNTLRQSRGEL